MGKDLGRKEGNSLPDSIAAYSIIIILTAGRPSLMNASPHILSTDYHLHPSVLPRLLPTLKAAQCSKINAIYPVH